MNNWYGIRKNELYFVPLHRKMNHSTLNTRKEGKGGASRKARRLSRKSKALISEEQGAYLGRARRLFKKSKALI